MPRRRPDVKPRPRIDLDLVVQTAIAVLDEEGLDNLTTRRLAARLGVQSPALYWHVRGKEELLDLVAEAICAPALDSVVALASVAEQSWRERLEALGRILRDVLRSHRDAPRLLAERVHLGPVRRSLGDATVGLVIEAGFSDADVAMISVFLNDYLTSMVAAELRLSARAAGMAKEVEQGQGQEVSREYPNLAHIAPYLATVRPEAIFEAGLELLLDGLERRLEGRRATSRRADV